MYYPNSIESVKALGLTHTPKATSSTGEDCPKPEPNVFVPVQCGIILINIPSHPPGSEHSLSEVPQGVYSQPHTVKGTT